VVSWDEELGFGSGAEFIGSGDCAVQSKGREAMDGHFESNGTRGRTAMVLESERDGRGRRRLPLLAFDSHPRVSAEQQY
jgi:hypothetical protein